MPLTADGTALGLIETRGLTGAVEAADAAVKSALVDVLSLERASGGLVTVALVGDVASVSEAVAHAREKAAAVGELVSAHVIPRPDESVWKLFPSLRQADESAPDPEEDAPVEEHGSDEPGRTSVEDYQKLPVRELRRRARNFPGIELSGREISRASKSELLKAFRAALEGE